MTRRGGGAEGACTRGALAWAQASQCGLVVRLSKGFDLRLRLRSSGVGTLLLCHLADYSIARSHDQPGSGGGNYYAFQAESGALLHGWKAIDEIEQAT